MIDRYEPEFLEEYDWTPIRKDADGDYVLFSDYDALRTALRELVNIAEEIAQEAHTMGRIYQTTLSPSNPATEFDKVSEMVKRKIQSIAAAKALKLELK